MSHRTAPSELKAPLLDSVLPSNEEHLKRAAQAVGGLTAERIGIVGLAFKQNTDDLRESPVVRLLEQLLASGRQVRVFDPHIQLDWIYGKNRSFLLSVIPHIGNILERSLEDLMGWADHVVLTQPADADTARKLAQRGLPVLDLSTAATGRTQPALAFAQDTDGRARR